jgi:phosphoribosylanthranilate isomerase
MVWIKICGITNKEDALGVASLGANALGFILSTDSARKIKPEKAKEIILAIKDKFKKDKFTKDKFIKDKFINMQNKMGPSFVGVFVNENISKVTEIAGELDLDYIQLSGDEALDYLKKIKRHDKNIKLIKTIRVKGKDYASIFTALSKQMLEFKKAADFFLLDTFKDNIYGGTGESFSWELVKELSREYPLILAGGLDCENVAEAIQTVKPFGIDASSKLEISPGKKDIKKVEIFIRNAFIIKNALKKAD